MEALSSGAKFYCPYGSAQPEILIGSTNGKFGPSKVVELVVGI